MRAVLSDRNTRTVRGFQALLAQIRSEAYRVYPTRILALARDRRECGRVFAAAPMMAHFWAFLYGVYVALDQCRYVMTGPWLAILVINPLAGSSSFSFGVEELLLLCRGGVVSGDASAVVYASEEPLEVCEHVWTYPTLWRAVSRLPCFQASGCSDVLPHSSTLITR